MNDHNTDKKYESFKIPDRQQVQDGGGLWSFPQTKATTPATQDDGSFYVIDYDSSDMKGVGKFVLKSQKIDPPVKDEIRELFHSMRDIARANHVQFYGDNRFYNPRVQQENAKVFYKQGLFMKDFSDNYTEATPFSSYFPYYQMMSYEQLRTYFTWRAEVRKGNVTDTSLSYAFLYIYELLNNIGVDDSQDGLNKLMSFWKDFSVYNKTIDKYVLRWLKDYHIFYELSQSFQEFVEHNGLASHYPKMADTDNNFDLFCAISKYDIRSSAFCTSDNIKLVTDCFYFVTDKLRQIFIAKGLHFDESIFQPTKKMSAWQPFRGALFYPWKKQPDRRVVLSENEIYICSQNNWTSGTVITSEEGRVFIGYIMKQMEAALRTATKYKYKLSANINTVTHPTVGKLKAAGLSLEKLVSDAVAEFYQEATKTIVTIDHSALSRIREEALAIQEKLIVPEKNDIYKHNQVPVHPSLATPQAKTQEITQDIPQRIRQAIPQEMYQNIPQFMIQDTPWKISQDVSQHMTQDKSQVVPQDTTSQEMTQDTPQRIRQAIPQEMYQNIPQFMIQDTPWEISQNKPQEMPQDSPHFMPQAAPQEMLQAAPPHIPQATPQDMPPNIPPMSWSVVSSPAISDVWQSLRNALSETELHALSVLLHGNMDIKKFADNNSIMLEVLIDGINEKAMDYVGDNLLDEEFTIYDDYKDQVKEMVE